MRAFSLLLLAATLASAAAPLRSTIVLRQKEKGPPESLFGFDKLYTIHLTVPADDWKRMQPKGGFGGFGGFGKPNTKLLDPDQVRNQFGMELTWVKGNLEIDGKVYKDIAVRFKGNGSLISAQGKLKRGLKIKLDTHVAGQTLSGLKKFALNPNTMDDTASREALSYAVYRALNVPAPRTAYAKVSLTVPGKYDKELVGLYTFVETVDKPFLRRHFGNANGLLLKPEKQTTALEYLGDEWAPYEQKYQPKTDPTEKSKRRLMGFAKLVHKADDKTFAREIGDYLDIDEFLRFLACTTAISSMDSFIGLAHNYYLYLDAKSNKFVFMPWDLDLGFGAFTVMGSPDDLMNMSIRKPNRGANRLVDRLMADDAIFATYKGHMRKLLEKGFTKERVAQDVKLINIATKETRDAEKAASSARMEFAGAAFGGLFKGVPDPATFAAKRIKSIEEQLDGKSTGKSVGFGFGGGGFGGPKGDFGPGRFLVKPVLEGADKDKDGVLTREEMVAGAKALFKALDKDEKGEVDEKIAIAGMDKLMPPPPKMPAGFPTFGSTIAKALIQQGGKDGKLTEKGMLAAAEKLFAGADKNKDGKLDDKELPEALRNFFPPPKFGPGPKK